jgi:uncharacterized membrane protein
MTKESKALGRWMAHGRFVLFVVIFAAAGFAAGVWFDWRQAVMIGFDLAAVIFLLSCLSLLNDTPAIMRRKAKENDANRGVLLAITGLVSIVILVTVGTELAGKTDKGPPVALIIVTLTLAWLFSNVIYAVHYAHLYYSQKRGTGGDAAGIDFPGKEQPDYSDFVYFAFTLGMTFQTSDLAIVGRGIRRVAIVHSFAAFVFNIGVLAFTINVLGGG